MANQVITGDKAREAVMRGLRTQAAAVKSTLGPKGQNVLFVRPYGLAVTRDGVSVAKEIELEDPLECAGARLLRMVASSADDEAGDGTTTAVVLAEAILDKGMRLVTAGADRIQLERGLRTAVTWTIAELAKQAIPATPDLIRHAATVSLHGDAHLGSIVADAIERVGAEGMITHEESASGETRLEHQAGFQWEQGWVQPWFVNDPATKTCVLEEPLIFLSERPLLSCTHLQPTSKYNIYNLLNRVAGEEAGRPLLIISEKVDGDALTVLAANIQKGLLLSCAVEPPGFGARRKESLRDLAIACGAEDVYSSERGHDLSQWTPKMLGTCRRAIIGERQTMLVEPGGKLKAVAERAEQLRALRGATDDDYEKEQLTARVGRLTNGAVVIHVHAATQAELKERKDRLQDAVFSARAAAKEGILPGGGVALLKAARQVELEIERSQMSEQERMGARLLLSALEAPARQIAENAGAKPDVVLDEIRKNLDMNDAEEGYGFNAATGEYEDLVCAGVVDPVRVTRVALEKAASIAGLLLTTEAVVCHLPVNAGGQQGR